MTASLTEYNAMARLRKPLRDQRTLLLSQKGVLSLDLACAPWKHYSIGDRGIQPGTIPYFDVGRLDTPRKVISCR